MFKMKNVKFTGLIIGLFLLILGYSLTPKPNKNDESLNPFPMTLSESIAQAVSPSGQGIFVVNSCGTISGPVNGGTWCFTPGPPPNISIYINNAFQSYIPSNQPADFGYNFIGIPAGSLIIKYVLLRTYTFPANFTASGNAAASLCSARVGATASTVFTILHNGTQVATATFAPSSATCTFSTQSSFAGSSGDSIAIESPASADATLSDISITLGATRN